MIASAVAVSIPHWETARTFVLNLIHDWTPNNWIAFLAACLSLILGIYNNRTANSRERIKNRREEFHRRVATRIEAALDDFRAILDELHDVRDGPAGVKNFDDLLRKAKAAQRKLSRELRNAANSGHCSQDGWDIGSDEYDQFIECIEILRTSDAESYRQDLAGAIGALDRQDMAVREKINFELGKYT